MACYASEKWSETICMEKPADLEQLRDEWIASGMEGDCPRCGQASGFHDDDGMCEDEQEQTEADWEED